MGYSSGEYRPKPRLILMLARILGHKLYWLCSPRVGRVIMCIMLNRDMIYYYIAVLFSFRTISVLVLGREAPAFVGRRGCTRTGY